MYCLHYFFLFFLPFTMNKVMYIVTWTGIGNRQWSECVAERRRRPGVQTDCRWSQSGNLPVRQTIKVSRLLWCRWPISQSRCRRRDVAIQRLQFAETHSHTLQFISTFSANHPGRSNHSYTVDTRPKTIANSLLRGQPILANTQMS